MEITKFSSGQSSMVVVQLQPFTGILVRSSFVNRYFIIDNRFLDDFCAFVSFVLVLLITSI